LLAGAAAPSGQLPGAVACLLLPQGLLLLLPLLP
jgi:hypothetical protein